ncbi:hypothetical protein HDK90DRAFT_515683 [Phyllosticta capitalensis]|uniref:Uncharacterized protein n=1 Tax=Phyllosticta capitalensis TaxID=121624 RepID=A0ABR1Y9G9_9PEZI
MSSINRHTQPILHSILHALDDSGGAEGQYDVALQLDWNPQSISSELEQYAHDKWHPSTPRGALNFADACRAINKLAMANLETYAFVTRRFDAELLAWTADLVKELVGGQSVLKHGLRGGNDRRVFADIRDGSTFVYASSSDKAVIAQVGEILAWIGAVFSGVEYAPFLKCTERRGYWTHLHISFAAGLPAERDGKNDGQMGVEQQEVEDEGSG